MATYRKVLTKAGIPRFSAIIKFNSFRVSKTFSKKSYAKEWAVTAEDLINKAKAKNQAPKTPDELRAIVNGVTNSAKPFNELVKEYFANYSGKDTSRVTRVCYWQDALSITPLENISVSLIQKHLDKLASGKALINAGFDENGKKRLATLNKKRSPATINRYKMALSAVLNFAVKREYIHKNPCHKIDSLKESKGRERYLSDSERERLLEACKQSKWDKLYCLVLLAMTTGARRGELFKLRWNDINVKDRTAKLYDTKNGEDRTIPITQIAFQELMKHYVIGDDLILNSEKRRFTVKYFYSAWIQALKLAGITDFRFHDLRHTAASYFVMNGASLYETGEILGHKSVQTTKRYAHLSENHKLETVDNVFSKIGL